MVGTAFFESKYELRVLLVNQWALT